MSQRQIIKLRNLSPIHIGTGKENYDFSAGELHSDTLSAALAAVGIQKGLLNDAHAFMKSVRLSTAFPYYRDMYFLPKPQGKINAKIDGQEEHEYRKKLKKVKFVERSLWQQLINGNQLRLSKNQITGHFIIPADKSMPEFCKSQVNQRVSVSRDCDIAPTPFFFDWHYYDKEAGLYCMVATDGDITLNKLVILFELLGELGVGTDKSVGGGHFEVSSDKIEIAEPVEASSTMLLSLYIPAESEMKSLFNGEPKYTLVRRGGYMAGSSVEQFRRLRKKTVYAFGVGSVFKTVLKLDGKIVDLKPEWDDEEMHPVCRSGKPMTVKISL